MSTLRPMSDSRHPKYLGLPSIIGKSKTEVFAKIKERVGKKLSSWREKLLSIGGKEVLIKVVVQAIPTYTMSCFQLPKGLCDEMEGMMRRFWWGQRQKETKIACNVSKLRLEAANKTRLPCGLNLQSSILSLWRCPPSKARVESLIHLEKHSEWVGSD